MFPNAYFPNIYFPEIYFPNQTTSPIYIDTIKYQNNVKNSILAQKQKILNKINMLNNMEPDVPPDGFLFQESKSLEINKTRLKLLKALAEIDRLNKKLQEANS